jgi:uncharacterized protein YhaN
MRIERVRLKNFCGVDEAEVRFSTSGVTLIHGPNETGKSTLMTGIDILFEFRDDSRNEEVRNTKHVMRDVGAEVEADVRVAEFQFTYFKRFHKERETRLTIHSPRPETLTGRDAHDRVTQILQGNVDIALWRALRIMQGRNLEMPKLDDQRALAAALDQVAGQAQAGERESALYEAAYSEYAKYYTETGKEKDNPLGQARAKATATETRERDLRADLDSLEADVTRHAVLEKSLISLKQSLAGLIAAATNAQTVWDSVSSLENEADRARTNKKLADQTMLTSRDAMERRTDLVNRVSDIEARLAGARAELEKTEAALTNAALSLNEARAKREMAAGEVRRCDSEEAVRRADLDFREEEFRLVRLMERLQHVNEADAAAASAAALVSTTKITEGLRNKIRAAEDRFRTERSIRNLASPRMTITALKPIGLRLMGEQSALAAGQSRMLVAEEVVSATIGDVVAIRVEPGTSADELRQAVEDAESELALLCAEAGVSNAEEAESAWSGLLEARRTLEERDRVARQHLRDLTHEQLAKLVRDQTASVEGYVATRNSLIALPSSVEECKPLLAEASKASEAARAVATTADEVFGKTQEYHGECQINHVRSSTNWERDTGDFEIAIISLEQARAAEDDAALMKALTASELEAEAASMALARAQRAVDAANPEMVKARLAAATTSVKNTRNDLDARERELVGLRTRLDLIGEKGLAEALADAERARFEADDHLSRLLRRASAAKLLYDTLIAERQAMQLAYVAPLRERIERLGRHVYGDSFSVEVNEELQVIKRTVDGVTVSIKQLSTGAREQLGLLVRLAVAAMVSADGGVPLVLDDALGSTDDDRLEALGAVLRVASQEAQTIVLTCSPERYMHVGAEVVVSLP